MSIIKKSVKNRLCKACANRLRYLRPTTVDFGVDGTITSKKLLNKTFKLVYDMDAFVRDVRDNATTVIIDGVERDISDPETISMRSDKNVESKFVLPEWVVHDADGRMEKLDEVRRFVKKYKKNERRRNLYLSFTHRFDLIVEYIEDGNIPAAIDLIDGLETTAKGFKPELRRVVHLKRVRNEVLTLTQHFDDIGIEWIDTEHESRLEGKII